MNLPSGGGVGCRAEGKEKETDATQAAFRYLSHCFSLWPCGFRLACGRAVIHGHTEVRRFDYHGLFELVFIDRGKSLQKSAEIGLVVEASSGTDIWAGLYRSASVGQSVGCRCMDHCWAHQPVWSPCNTSTLSEVYCQRAFSCYTSNMDKFGQSREEKGRIEKNWGREEGRVLKRRVE